jgi:hypothetical protein
MEPSESVQENVRILADLFVPIYNEFWERRGRAYYGIKDWNINPVPLVQLWAERNLILIMAFEGEEVVGFLMGGRMTPFFQIEANCYVETYYGRDKEIERGLLSCLRNGFKFTSERFLLVPDYGEPIEFDPPLSFFSSRRTNVYKR